MKNEKVEVGIRCPYCGVKQSQLVDPIVVGPQVVLCYSEEGGCDLYFAVHVCTEYVVRETYELVQAYLGDEALGKAKAEEEVKERPFGLGIELVEGAVDPEVLRNSNWLERAHHDEGLSVPDIGKLCGVSAYLVEKAMQELDVERRKYQGRRSQVADAH